VEENCVRVGLNVNGQLIDYRVTRQLDVFVFEPLFKLHQSVKAPFFCVHFSDGDYTVSKGIEQVVLAQGLKVINHQFNVAIPGKALQVS
jgi:hypothetical protein